MRPPASVRILSPCGLAGWCGVILTIALGSACMPEWTVHPRGGRRVAAVGDSILRQLEFYGPTHPQSTRALTRSIQDAGWRASVRGGKRLEGRADTAISPPTPLPAGRMGSWSSAGSTTWRGFGNDNGLRWPGTSRRLGPLPSPPPSPCGCRSEKRGGRS